MRSRIPGTAGLFGLLARGDDARNDRECHRGEGDEDHEEDHGLHGRPGRRADHRKGLGRGSDSALQRAGRGPGAYYSGMRGRWFNSRALGLHAALAVIVPGCLLAGWWQLHVALGGNGLSWAYTFEWPAFAVIATVAWWHLVHEDPAQRAVRLRPDTVPSPTPASPDPDDLDRPPADQRQRVIEAARREYQAHLARQEAAEAAR